MNHHKNMQLLSMHPNHYKFFTFFSFSKRKEKMSSLSTKERKAKFNTNGLIFRKSLIYLLEHCYLLNGIPLNTVPLNH